MHMIIHARTLRTQQLTYVWARIRGDWEASFLLNFSSVTFLKHKLLILYKYIHV